MTKAMLQLAITYANEMHKEQFRKGGCELPYIVHPIDVLNRMHRWGIRDSPLLIAAVLHDVIEDCEDTRENIFDQFGPTVHDYVVEMTYAYMGKSKEDKKLYLESFQSKSIGSLLIKLADRLCNVEDYYFDGSTGDYPQKYFRKADALYKAFLLRKAECIEKYGSKCYTAAFDDLEIVAARFGVWQEILCGVVGEKNAGIAT